ncbi:hypothetical protein H2136_00190 [Aeromonas hydrophila]|uniref:Uncharacterized protein n=1 Tax=Aeromonas hydrophila TaxID=644 RepID=A0A926FJC4_AERHY|nr:hypothetical protein [Aeromonas hydrophila]
MLEFSQSTRPLIELFPRAASPCTATPRSSGPWGLRSPSTPPQPRRTKPRWPAC